MEALDDLEFIALLGEHALRQIKSDVKKIDSIPDSAKPQDGPKQMQNTGHDIALVRANTIHDKLANNPAMLESVKNLIREFGRPGVYRE